MSPMRDERRWGRIALVLGLALASPVRAQSPPPAASTATAQPSTAPRRLRLVRPGEPPSAAATRASARANAQRILRAFGRDAPSANSVLGGHAGARDSASDAFGSLGLPGLRAAPDAHNPGVAGAAGIGGMGRVGGTRTGDFGAGEGYGVGAARTPASCRSEGTLVTQLDAASGSIERPAVERSVASHECALVRCFHAVTDWPAAYVTVRLARGTPGDRAADAPLVGPDRAPAFLRSCVARVLQRPALPQLARSAPAQVTLVLRPAVAAPAAPRSTRFGPAP